MSIFIYFFAFHQLLRFASRQTDRQAALPAALSDAQMDGQTDGQPRNAGSILRESRPLDGGKTP
jgi:hypothetical protein